MVGFGACKVRRRTGGATGLVGAGLEGWRRDNGKTVDIWQGILVNNGDPPSTMGAMPPRSPEARVWEGGSIFGVVERCS